MTAAAEAPDPAVLAPDAAGSDIDANPAALRGQLRCQTARRHCHRPARAATEPAARASASANASTDVIAVQHLTRRFGDFVAVNDVSFTVARGEIFGLLGANGAGKSTTFRMLCGLLPPSAGTLQVAGFDLRKAAAPARGRIGYMAQRFSLYGDLSVRQNLRFFSSAYRLSGARQRTRIDWAGPSSISARCSTPPRATCRSATSSVWRWPVR